MNYTEINEKILELEQKKLNFMKEKHKVEQDIAQVTSEIKSYRRKFEEVKRETIQIRKNRQNKEVTKKIVKTIGKCVECNATDNLRVHHIVPLSLGGTNKQNNLQVLCVQCHNKKHRTG